MNNGRDCLHGRQVGKCDTCDLIKAELELQRVTAERDALSAQVAAQQVLLKCWQTWLGSSRESCDDSGAKLWDKIEESCNAKPQHHLAAHDAEVAARAADDLIQNVVFLHFHGVPFVGLESLQNYADQLRAKTKP